jgi:hypothetical protein
MNPVVKMLLDSLIKYLETHPDQADVLVEALVNLIIGNLKQNAPKA